MDPYEEFAEDIEEFNRIDQELRFPRGWLAEEIRVTLREEEDRIMEEMTKNLLSKKEARDLLKSLL